ncbi:LOW QUALITY PROTEIN: uncharacterized protein LOC144765813 [Lissotriton helveticus]
MGAKPSLVMQSGNDHDYVVAPSVEIPHPTQERTPAEVDKLLSLAIAQALAPLQDSVNKLSAHVFKTGTGILGDSGDGPSGIHSVVPRKAVKRDTGHLEGFSKLAEVFHKSARTLRSAPYWEEALPGYTLWLTHPRFVPDEGFPDGREGEDDDVFEDNDNSSDDMLDSGRSWRPRSSCSDLGEGEPVHADMFDPTCIFRPRTSDWVPDKKTADYVAAKIRQPLSQDVRSRLRSECPRPSLPNGVATTPEIDPKLCTFFAKYMKDPKKVIDRSWRACQDKLLDVVGPLTKIIELAERSQESGQPLPTDDVAGWAQRAMCLLGNANCALSAERRRSLLLKIDPKLGELSSEAGSVVQGTLFGDPFVKELGKFVATFSALDKAQASMKKILPKKVFGGAGRGRGRSSGRQYNQGPNRGQAKRNNGWNDGRQGTFYPSRGGKGLGNQNSRGFNGKLKNSLPCSFGGQDFSVSGKLGRSDVRPMGVRDGSGFSHRVLRLPRSDLSPSPFGFFRLRVRSDRSRSSRPSFQRRYRSFSFSSAWLFKQYLSGRKERQRIQTSYQPQVLQRVVGLSTLQDGGNPSAQRPPSPERLVSSLGPQGCLPVPIFPPHCKFLQFLWKGQTYEFRTLPFGLSSAPWCFTKLLRPVVEYLRTKGIRLIIYLDDILQMEQSRDQLLLHLQVTISLLQNLGFIINAQKSDLVPQQSMIFLGFRIDTRDATLNLPSQKISKIKKEIRKVLRQDRISLRQLARIVGLLSSSIQAIYPGPLHYRTLQRLKASHLRRGLTYSELISLSSEAKSELLWWIDHMEARNGSATFGSRPDLVIESDASRLGWGGQMRLPLGRRPVDGGGTSNPYQLPGTPSGFFCHSFIHDRQGIPLRPSQNGKHDGGEVHQSSWRYTFQDPGGPRQGFLALLPPTSDFCDGRISPGSSELCSGLAL